MKKQGMKFKFYPELLIAGQKQRNGELCPLLNKMAVPETGAGFDRGKWYPKPIGKGG